MTNGINPNDPIRKVGVEGQPGAQESGRASDTDPTRFRRMLEELERKAESLRGRSDQVNDSTGLRDAVSEAKGSLDDALKLQQDLLESFRAARQSGGFKESA